MKPYIYYKACICVNGKLIRKRYPYTSDGEVLAAKAYNEMAVKYFGEFAFLNPGVMPERL